MILCYEHIYLFPIRSINIRGALTLALGISSHPLYCLIYIMQSQHPMWRLGCFGHFGLAIKLQSTDNFGYQLGTRIIWRWNLRLVLSLIVFTLCI